MRDVVNQARHGRGFLAGALTALVVLCGCSTALAAPTIAPLAVATEGLPDGRALERVTPADKENIDILAPSSDSDFLLTSVDGQAVVSETRGALPGSPANYPANAYRSRRGSAGWSTESILPPGYDNGGVRNFPLATGFSEDLSKEVEDAGTPGAALLERHDLYLRDNESGTYQLLTGGLAPPPIGGFPSFDGASHDFSRLFIEDANSLLPGAPVGTVGVLYESSEGQLHLAGILPNGQPAPYGTVAGSGGGVSASFANVKGSDEYAVSEDGTRVYFTTENAAEELDEIYLRENGKTTVPVSATQRIPADPAGHKPPRFWSGSKDGSKAFFTSSEELTENANTGPEDAGTDLYEYDADTGLLTDLTADHEPQDPNGAVVRGVVQASDDGSYVYFVAGGKLSADAPTPAAENNLYLWHDGHTSFIAALAGSDYQDWAVLANARSSRISQDGTHLMFGSIANLTGYESEGFEEIYVYDAVSNTLACASCDPNGAKPTGSAKIATGETTSSQRQNRGLSSDGKQVFFDSPDSLVPGDVNGVRDVYEYEEGKVYLLSGGRSDHPAEVADSSLSGEDVFFTTRDQLVAADHDDDVDVYDARVGGVTEKRVVSSPCSGEDCQGPLAAAPPLSVAGSAAVTGPGNLSPGSPAATKAKPKPKRKQHAAVRKKAKAKQKKSKGKAKGKKADKAKPARRRRGKTRANSVPRRTQR